jgi:undecaprenyl-diphosphatase
MHIFSMTRIRPNPLLLEFVVFGGLSLAFLALLLGAPHAAPSAFDRNLTVDIQAITSGHWRVIPQLGSDVGGGFYGTIVVPGIVGAFLAVTRRWRLLALLALVFALHYLLISPKLFIHAYRPSPDFGVQGGGGLESFPSGHVQWATSFYGFVALMAWRQAGHRRAAAILIAGMFVTIVLGTMLGRVALGRHWPVDVLGGLLVGLIALRILALLHPPRRSPESSPAPAAEAALTV